MKLIGLPGRNAETEAWMTGLLEDLSFGQHAASVAHYRHWDDSSEPDLLHEASRLTISDADLVVAKSMGTLVLLTHCLRGSRPFRAVFIGTPLKAYSSEKLASLKSFADQTPSLFIQQKSDIAGSFAGLEPVVRECAKATLVQIPGEDHIYSDTDELGLIIENWWSDAADG
jgi:hypothetical protein